MMIHQGGSGSSLESYFESQGLSTASIDGFNIESTEEDTLAGVKVQRAHASNGEEELQTKIISSADSQLAKGYLGDRKREIKSIYSDTPAPYAGVPGREVNCPQQFQPNISRKQVDNTNYTYYELFADQELNFGVCSKENIKYKVSMVTAYCHDTSSILEIKHFWPVNMNNKSIVEQVRCG